MSGKIKPQVFLGIDDEQLKLLGFSRQKTRYTRILAEKILKNPDFLNDTNAMSDEDAKAHLIQLVGIGAWTADVYISECMLRPDILPKGDIALNEAFKVLKKMDKRPKYDELLEKTQHWRPWRSVGIRLLWHFYLCEREKQKKQKK